MDFANRLSNALDHGEGLMNDISSVLQWNEDIETFLAASPEPFASEDAKEESSEGTISEVAAALHENIIRAILLRNFGSSGDIDAETRLAIQQYRENPLSPYSKALFQSIRAGKNMIRWYIQIYLERKGRVLPSRVATLQSRPLLELLMVILEYNALKEDILQQDISRNISLYLFYATYVAFPGDDGAQQALQQMTMELGFPELSLRILTRTCSAPLALALIRNLHNAIVTLQGAAKTILSTKIDWSTATSPLSDPAPWAPSDDRTVNFQSTCVNVLLWALKSEPPFPGKDDDKRAELASEILGSFYAIRAGKQLVPGRCDENLMELVVTILKLPNAAKDKRIEQCKLSTVSLLMDADRSFGEYLLSKNGIQCLLDLLERQVTEILDNTLVDNSATAALVPILVVLNKYASSNSDIRQKTKLTIFPADAEAAFREKAEEQQQRESSTTANQKKNMGPLDAPAGTLRRKLCTLLTWPEGHIKRCTGELLWTLCSSEPTEFVNRVGFGNALPILSVKGLAQMPIPQS